VSGNDAGESCARFRCHRLLPPKPYLHSTPPPMQVLAPFQRRWGGGSMFKSSKFNVS
jgi:hypothetical protein